jgi:L-ascorbate metabolism protein UlaG (beta-lactamase superfamily)
MERSGFIFLACVCAVALGSRLMAAEIGENEVRITWPGHAFFLVESREARVAIDPYNEGVGYPMPDVSADVVLVTHEHGDHNNVGAVKGSPVVVRGVGPHEAAGIAVKGIATKHYDDPKDTRRGDNTVFAWEQAGVRVAHCGDLGHLLSETQVAEVGPIDVLMIPVGGFYTIDAAEAKRVVAQLEPKVVLPMHYRTDVMEGKPSPLAPVDDFLGLMKDAANVKREGKHSITLSADTLPQDKPDVVLLTWK